MINPCACLTHLVELLQKQKVTAAELGVKEERSAVPLSQVEDSTTEEK